MNDGIKRKRMNEKGGMMKSSGFRNYRTTRFNSFAIFTEERGMS
jgi:hypothetical protein